MTLHWWMHWFWVTILLVMIICGGTSVAAPQSDELQHISTDLDTEHLERRGRAMYFTKSPPAPTDRAASTAPTTMTPPITQPNDHTTTYLPNTTSTVIVNVTRLSNDESKHTQIDDKPIPTNVSTTIPNVNVTLTKAETQGLNISILPSVSTNLTTTTTTPQLQNGTSTKRRNNLTRLSEPKESDAAVQGVSESRIVTEKPLSLETALLQTRLPPNIESSRRIVEAEEEGKKDGMDTGAVAGISFAALAVVALGGSTGFVLYRRRFLNKPQTLNDKCSNPDSSGYLDDSTVRENSEEMYSLDNDSFLNSLEAMTIQNYWTDTVKHTKL